MLAGMLPRVAVLLLKPCGCCVCVVWGEKEGEIFRVKESGQSVLESKPSACSQLALFKSIVQSVQLTQSNPHPRGLAQSDSLKIWA